MTASFERFHKRRLMSSYFSVVVSIALVLFLLGLLGLLVLNAKKISDNTKEKVVLTIYINDSAKPIEIDQLNRSLMLSPYVKAATFISKEEAAESMKSEFGEDFIDDVGYNPLQNSIDVNLKADFVTAQRLDSIAEINLEKSFVDDVRYDKDLVALMNDNVKRISLWVLIISVVFTVIAVLLINSSIRLAIYSKRFVIKTMQMVGATKGFIRSPFIWRSIRLGIIGAILAIAAVFAVLYYVNQTFPELRLTEDMTMLALLAGSILALGIGITWISTYLATQRFLNLKTDQLYY